MKKGRPRRNDATNRFGLLLALFLGQMLSAPIFEGSLAAGYVCDILFYMLLAAAAFSIQKSRSFRLSLVLGVGSIITEAISYFVDHISVLVIANVIACAFLMLVTIEIGVTVAKQREIRADTVMGGLCVYVLMGVFLTVLYMGLESLQPGSFSFGVHGPHPDLDVRFRLLYYYSYVTLLTIGFGDVVPMSGMAQSLTILEALIGQFYLVSFMASLVGLYIYRRVSGVPGGESTDRPGPAGRFKRQEAAGSADLPADGE